MTEDLLASQEGFSSMELVFSLMAQHPPSGPGPHHRSFTITLRRTTLGRTPLSEWPALRRDLHLTTHNIYKRHTSGIRTRSPSKRADADPRLYRAATGNGSCNYCGFLNFRIWVLGCMKTVRFLWRTNMYVLATLFSSAVLFTCAYCCTAQFDTVTGTGLGCSIGRGCYQPCIQQPVFYCFVSTLHITFLYKTTDPTLPWQCPQTFHRGLGPVVGTHWHWN